MTGKEGDPGAGLAVTQCCLFVPSMPHSRLKWGKSEEIALKSQEQGRNDKNFNLILKVLVCLLISSFSSNLLEGLNGV